MYENTTVNFKLTFTQNYSYYMITVWGDLGVFYLSQLSASLTLFRSLL